MKTRISYSVGKGGRNDRDDVRVIQAKLNQFIFSPSPKLRTDGYAGKKTIGAIKEFQKTYTNLRHIDGRVDPHGATIGRLNGSITFHPVHIHASNGINAQENTFGSRESEILVEKEIKRRGGTDSDYERFMDFYANIKPQINMYRKGIGTINNIRKWIDVYGFFKLVGFVKPTADYTYHISILKNSMFKDWFRSFLKAEGSAVKIFKAASEPSNRISKLFNSVSDWGSKLGLVIVFIDVSYAITKGDFGVATGKIYKYAMGKRVPWASMIGALQEFVELVLPGSAKNNNLFKFLRAADPIGLGEKGVDSVITTLCCLVQYAFGDSTGSAKKFHSLGGRLGKGPTAFFAELADWEWVVRYYFPGVYEQDKQTFLQLRRRYDRIPAVTTMIPIHQKL